MSRTDSPLKTLNHWRRQWVGNLLAGDIGHQFELIAIAVTLITGTFMMVAPDAMLFNSELICAVIALSLLAIHRLRPNWRTVLTWLLWATVQATVFLAVCLQGGIWSLSMGYFFISGVPMLMILGLRSALWSTSFSALLIAAIAWMEWRGYMPPSVIPSSNHVWPLTMLITLMLGFIALPFVIFQIQRQTARQLNRDNASLKEAHRALRAQHRVQEQFVASVSHELRTPMNAIMGFLQTIERHQDFAPEEQEMLTQMELSAQQLLSRINELLDFSQLQADKLRIHPITLNLRQEVSDVIAVFAEQASDKSLQINTHFSPNAPTWVTGDPERIRQVIRNLIDNAVKFTPHGSVDIEVSYAPTQVVRIAVTDHGPGIPEAELKLIFSRLSTITSRTRRERGGTGLGLPIAQALAQLMGGHIDVHSVVGQGSTFSFELALPIADAPQVCPPTVDDAPKAGDLQGHVLIVDDSPVNRLVAKNMMKAELPQVTVHEASGGAEALSLMEQQAMDVVLMDVIMPEMDGFQATAHILSRHPELAPTVLGLTADTTDDVKAQCLDIGMAGIIYKPFDRASLTQPVYQHLLLRAAARP